MESKTPRTDAALFIALSERHYETKIVTAVDFARQLETELAEALAKLDSKQDIVDQLRLDSEIYCDRLKEARAEIEKLKVWLNENHAIDAMIIRNHARTIEKRDEEIERKDKLIEQLRVVSEHRKAIMLEIADRLENNKLTDEDDFEDDLINSLRTHAEDKAALEAAIRAARGE